MGDNSSQDYNLGFLEEAVKEFIPLLQNFSDYKSNPENNSFLKLVFDNNHSLLGIFTFCENQDLIEFSSQIETVLTKILSKEKLFNKALEVMLDISFVKLKELLQFKIQNKTSDDHRIILLELQNIDRVKTEIVKTERVLPQEVKVQKIQNVQEIKERADQIKKTVDNNAENVVKVNIQLLDKIMNIIGELVVNRNQILQFAQKLENPDLLKLTGQLDSITTDLQNDIMGTRMQPVGTVINKFERLVRDLALKQKKKIAFKVYGEDTELDKTLLEAIKDPLTHLIRNAIDHGIEFPEERLLAGKDEVGSLSINAFHEGGMVNIVIKDNGKGLNLEKIIAKAISKNLVTEAESKKLTDKEVCQFIFAAGFSTAEQVTDISGRGVGMDVVRNNIEKIGGSIEIETVSGKGASFSLKIPLTLAIIPALIFRAKGHFFSIPEVNLSEFLLVKEDEQKGLINEIQGATFFRLREKLVPLFSINEYFKLGEFDSHYQQNADNTSGPMNIIVLTSDGVDFGILVDEIVKLEEVVVKPLCQSVKKLEVYSGAAILGNGEIALILDAAAFIKKQGVTHSVKYLGEAESKTEHEIVLDESNSIEYLVFSLFDGGNYAIPLSFVNRLEDLTLDNLEKSEDHYLVRYREVAMPLVDLQKEINPNSPDLIQSLELLKNKKARILVMSFMSHLVGIVVNDILNTTKSNSEVDQFSVESKEVLGTINLNGKTITLLNLKHILDRKFNNEKDFDTNNSVENEKVIVLIEEKKIHQSMCQEFLEFEGFKVVPFFKAEDLILFLKNQVSQVQMILIDSELKKLGIHKLAQEIKDDLLMAHIPIIGLTGGNFDIARDIPNDSKVDTFVNMYSKESLLDVVFQTAGTNRNSLNNESIESFEDDSHFCGIRIDKEYFAIPLRNVQEVLRPQQISKIPLAKGCLQGLINLRGQIIPYIKLREILRFDSMSENNEKVNIILRQGDMMVSISADEIFDVFDMDQDFLSEVPESIEEERKSYLTSVYQMPNRLVSILDVEKIVNHTLV